MSIEQNARLQGSHLRLGYENYTVFDDIDVCIPDHQFTVIVGPNGCGKSTLLRTLCRLIKPQSGQVCLDGHDIHQFPTKALARQLGLLPQSAIAPDGIRVLDLVARGRYPHQQLFRQWSLEDERAVRDAMQVTGVETLAERQVDELSGGQRQRVWIAMVLAQQTPLLLLDEPTTYLDIAHQIELLELFRDLNRNSGHTLIAVLHDLNQACRYADHMIAMAHGRIIAEGNPSELISAELVREVFGLESVIIDDPVSHTPLVIPLGRERHE
ncbi:ABC transporter ATP-binding protein [Vibrio cincinnatiensis]|uniref:ABC transporter ATP-binding protein n=1 Tax=Vibrio cincinnatiensis TaxID=675 RepID=UPI001EDCAFC3|nr:ABC transporter ATP-binding protein [Vibrio cincinnatiensis]MCG3731742.1 ABC transporter ATP-binding protein [Vibrio cincinnatiensis]MCG3734850.1 ABC transporter ATP-binding protein [Vibrio cincinnatiensis]MCG3739438.1 ABC transporter ATP-binding protein [Vibrio cincinnatiensis]MCG3742189.1 ABC transporter ATP-binding protein [Vibrio cincinnatiensis]MCG3765039.1 ABC transporter ATP-binding protein [Vibrio cincinnatiensis]